MNHSNKTYTLLFIHNRKIGWPDLLWYKILLTLEQSLISFQLLSVYNCLRAKRILIQPEFKEYNNRWGAMWQRISCQGCVYTGCHSRVNRGIQSASPLGWGLGLKLLEWARVNCQNSFPASNLETGKHFTMLTALWCSFCKWYSLFGQKEIHYHRVINWKWGQQCRKQPIQCRK